jgi:acyl-CoA dehydrogenase
MFLSDEDETFRKEVRAFIAASLTPELQLGQKLSSGVYPEPEISRPWHIALHEKGWVAPLWPKELGGTGWTPIQRFLFELECASSYAPLVYPMGIRLVGPVIIRFGTAEQRSRYLPRILSGADYWCQGYSEPQAGSDLAALSTKAVRDGDDYIISGTKIWTTHAHHANMMFALVRTADGGRPQEGISFLLIDMQSAGVTVRPIISMSGEHEVNQVYFDEVRVPRENLVGSENDGWTCAKYLLDFERGAGLFSARLRAGFSRVIDARAEFGHGFKDAERRRILEVSLDLDAFELMELHTIMSADDQAPAEMPSVLKLRASRLKQEVAQLGVELLGHRAVRGSTAIGADENHVPSLRDTLVAEYFNSRAFTIFGGSSEVQLNIIAKQVLR